MSALRHGPVDAHLYRCPHCKSVDYAESVHGGRMRCRHCLWLFRPGGAMLRPSRPLPVGGGERGRTVRRARDPRVLGQLAGMRHRARHAGEILERQLGASPVKKLEEMRNARFERLARALVRGA